MMKAVHVFLINPKNEILLQLRDDKQGIYFPGYWGTIGGAVEYGENPKEAIIREVSEEISLKLDNLEFISEINYWYARKLHILTFYKAKIDVPVLKIKLSEGQKVDYFSFDKLNRIAIVPSTKKFIYKHKNIIFSK